MAKSKKPKATSFATAPTIGYAGPRNITPAAPDLGLGKITTPIPINIGGSTITLPAPSLTPVQRTPVAPSLPPVQRTPIAPPTSIINKSNIDDYNMQHRPAMRDDDEGTTAPLYDITKVYPKDVFDKPDWYNMKGELDDYESYKIAKQVQGRPHAIVTIYRAVPKSLKGATINKGDWVTVNKEYARQHGISNIDGPYKIISKNVNAAEIFTSGDSINEWGYDPLSESERKKLQEVRVKLYQEKKMRENDK